MCLRSQRPYSQALGWTMRELGLTQQSGVFLFQEKEEKHMEAEQSSKCWLPTCTGAANMFYLHLLITLKKTNRGSGPLHPIISCWTVPSSEQLNAHVFSTSFKIDDWGLFPALPSSAKWCWPTTYFISCVAVKWEQWYLVRLLRNLNDRMYFKSLAQFLPHREQSMAAAIININSISINGGSAVNHNNKAG